MMKLRVLIGALLLCGLSSIATVAQQDPNDQGTADSAFMVISEADIHAPLAVEVYFFNDAQNVGSAAIGFSWDNPNLVLDSAVWSPEGLAAFSFLRIPFFRNDIDSSNVYQSFQLVGMRISGDGLAMSPDPKLICSYYFHYNTAGTVGDSVCITQDDFIPLDFVDLDNIEYAPVWRGDVCIGSGEPPDTTRIIEHPVTGHTYEYVKTPSAISWSTAASQAHGWGGYLATITDSIEADIVRRLLAQPGDEAWLGGRDSWVEGTWRWITGEPWDYTNWYPGEPNASQPDEDYLLAQHILDGRWVDVFDDNYGYIIERDNAPPIEALKGLTQWPVSEGGNGHWYGLLIGPSAWGHAQEIAATLNKEGKYGHLATVASQEENQFILDQILNGDWDGRPPNLEIPQAWLGGMTRNANWLWVDGEPFDYTNWAFGEPSETEYYPVLAMAGGEGSVIPEAPLPGEWMSVEQWCFGLTGVCATLVEFDTDPEPPVDTLINLVQWPESEGGNDHWYAIIPHSMNWWMADSLSGSFEIDGERGHLATVISPEENTFIANEVLLNVWPDTVFALRSEYWLGGYMTIAGWHWVTGEPFSFTNWADSMPGGWPDHAALAMVGHGWDINPPFPGQWIEVLPDCGYGGYPCRWSVVEFDTDSEPPVDSLVNLVHWPILEGGNGHWYAQIRRPMSWWQADSLARSFEVDGVTGHLATVGYDQENQFIVSQICPEWNDSGYVPTVITRENYWLGGRFLSGAWLWRTGELFHYSNWADGQPDESLVDPVIAMVGGYGYDPTLPAPGEWISHEAHCDLMPITTCGMAIIEFDTQEQLVNSRQWPKSEGGNDHWYGLMPRKLSWSHAFGFARSVTQEGVRGHLADIASAAENEFVADMLTVLEPSGADPLKTYFWLGGEKWPLREWGWGPGGSIPFTYTNWADGRPLPGEYSTQHLAMVGPGSDVNPPFVGEWMDFEEDPGMPNSSEELWSVVEFDTPKHYSPLIRVMQWPKSEGGNDHYYAVMPQDLDWHEADSASGIFIREGIAAHLATITSAEENEFVTTRIIAQLGPDMPHSDYWLGGLAGPDWTWVTDESWGYTNWLGGWPPDCPPMPGSELALAMHAPGFCDTPPIGGKWSAVDPMCLPSGECRWSIVEFDIEYTESPLTNLRQWPASEGGNGNWYALLIGPSYWEDAEDIAASIIIEGEPGHPATVASAEENQFILDQIMFGDWADKPPDFVIPQAWMGGEANSGVWEWANGEPFDYSNWGPGEPFNSDLGQKLAMSGGPTQICEDSPPAGEWMSVSPFGACGWFRSGATIVEFDTGPEQPPRTLHVPQEFPTIQLAIDSANHYDLVLVSPGTYHESLNFRGKAITVRSTDGPLVTTITNERTVDLVTFDQSEGPFSRLDGFTLRGGWMAILCISSSPTITHNICVGQNIWNWAAVGMCGDIERTVEPNGDPRYNVKNGSAPAILRNNTIVNAANGGISCYSMGEPATIINNIVAFNAHYGIHQYSEYWPSTIDYNDVYANNQDPDTSAHGDYINVPDPGPGAISEDPMFASNALNLGPLSPCVNAGDPDPGYNDPDGTRNDMGAVPLGGGTPDTLVYPTNEWIVVYCDGSAFENVPMDGMPMIAWDPDGVACGVDRIHPDGSFGFMAIYRDDPYTDHDEGAEPGDLITFSVGGETLHTTPEVYWTANGDVFEVCGFTSGSCLDITLNNGWNLISWNVEYHGDVYEAFEPIMGCLDVVHSFELGALTFAPELDGFNTLTHVDAHHGYWVRVNCDTTLRICGDPLAPWETIACEPGWNLISYWPPDWLMVEDALVSILPHLQQAMSFEVIAQVWMPEMAKFNTLKAMKPLLGYWAKVDTWLQVVYPGFIPFDCTSSEIVVRDPNSGATSAGIEPSRSWMSVYGDDISVDGQALTGNSRLEFRAGDVVCGEGVYTDGILKLTPIYGRDASGETSKLYAEDDDVISVFVEDKRVYPDLVWTGDGTRVRLAELTSGVALPTVFALKQNYPNPFNPSTNIAFELPVDGHVSLSIFNVLGQRVTTVTDQHYPAGCHQVIWEGDDDGGNRVATGIYFYRITVGDNVHTRKMMLLK